MLHTPPHCWHNRHPVLLSTMNNTSSQEEVRNAIFNFNSLKETEISPGSVPPLKKYTLANRSMFHFTVYQVNCPLWVCFSFNNKQLQQESNSYLIASTVCMQGNYFESLGGTTASLYIAKLLCWNPFCRDKLKQNKEPVLDGFVYQSYRNYQRAFIQVFLSESHYSTFSNWKWQERS